MNEAVLTIQQFQRLATYIENAYGIKMPSEKQAMMQARLARRIRDLQLANYDQYIDILLAGSPESERELSRMIDLMSTHMTAFFRERSHFTQLDTKILPELCNRFSFDRLNPLIFWSAAASTGEEAWSAAMLLAHFKQVNQARWPHFDFGVLGTDLSEGVLEKARKGIYPTSSLSTIPEAYFHHSVMMARRKSDQRFRLSPAIREHVFFNQLNLMESPYPIENKIHIVFCRNVLIYFDRPIQEMVLSNILEIMAPGAYLVLGHSETIINMNLPLLMVAPTMYQLIRV